MRLHQQFVQEEKNPKPNTRRDFVNLEARRRRAMRLLGMGHSQAEVARRLGVSEVSVCRWNKARISRGADAWRRGRLGKPPKVSEHHLSVLRGLVAAGSRVYGFADDRWTYARIATALKDITGLRIHPDHLCRIFQRQGWTGEGKLRWGPTGRDRAGCLPVFTPSMACDPELTPQR